MQKDLNSPEIANPTIGREVNSAVDYYTGTANVNINLYNISSYGINIPISVKYAASGVKTDDYPSPVGINWKLTGAGRVTRMIMGEPDETGYLDPESFGGLNSPIWTWKLSEIVNALERRYDGQPDIFRFELPTGLSGMFVLGKQNTIVMLPHQDIKIEWIPRYDFNPFEEVIDPDDPNNYTDEDRWVHNYSYFIITDSQGLKYHFGPTDDYRQYSYNGEYARTRDYMSDWLLERITYGDKDIVKYTYGIYKNFNKVYYNKLDRYEFRGSDNTSVLLNTKALNTTVNIFPKEVKKITWDLGEVEFFYDDNNFSSGPRLNHIDVYGYNKTPLKSIYLDMSFFSSGTFRSKIDRIYEKSGNKMREICYFKYYNDGNGIPSAAIAYDVDYWGYWTGLSSPKEEYSILGNKFNSNYRKPNLAATRCGTLQKIIYPTGGWTEFEYELHTGRHYMDLPIQQQTAGGLRVKSITNYESQGSVASTTQYVYESINDREKGGIIQSIYKPEPRYRKDIGSGSSRKITYSMTYKPDFPMTDFTGSSVVYNYVKEILPNGAYTTYEFTDFNSMRDIKGQSARSTSSGLGMSGEDSNYKVPYSTRFYGRGLPKKITKYDNTDQAVYQEEYTYNYGYVESSIGAYILFTDYEEEENPRMYRGSYEWFSQPVVLASKQTSGIHTQSTTTEYSYALANNYHKDLLPRTIVEKYGSDHFSTSFAYPQDYSSGSTPAQGSEAEGIERLKEMNIKIVPIETIKYRKNGDSGAWNVLGGNINIYKWSQIAGMPVLEQTKSLIINSISPTITKSYISGNQVMKDSRYDTYNSQTTQFNSKGNPEFITFSGANGRGTRMIYGYDGNVPVAQVTNISDNLQSYIYNTSFEKGSIQFNSNTILLGDKAKSGDYALMKNTPYNIVLDPQPHTISYWRWDGNENTTWEEVRISPQSTTYTIKEPNHYIDEIRVLPLEATITTQVIRPGIGIISNSGADGRVTRYNYNNLGMLESIADEGQVIEKYSYQEGSEIYNLSASVDAGSSGRGQASVNPTRIRTGGSATFVATPNSRYQFSKWQFSDGTSSTDASTVRNNIRFDLSGVASFVEFRQTYELSANVANTSLGRGQASVSASQVSEGDSATWSAIGFGGYVFDHWEFSDGTTSNTSTTTKTNISRNITGTAFFRESDKQAVDFVCTIMPRDGYWAVHISCDPDIISDGSIQIYASGYFFINPDTSDKIDIQFNGQISEDGYILSDTEFNENDVVGGLNGTISFSDVNYKKGTVSWL